MKKIILVITIALGLLAACQNNKKNDIATLEQKVINEDKTLNNDVAVQLIDAYINYVNSNPNDESNPETMFKALEIAVNMRDADKSMNVLDKLRNGYPEYEKTPAAIFMVSSMVCEDVLGDYGKAKGMYEELITRYPDSEWAATAEQAIKNLGKTPEELIREFELMNATDTTAY